VDSIALNIIVQKAMAWSNNQYVVETLIAFGATTVRVGLAQTLYYEKY